jgi:SAM-dependent methyltransferase
MSAVGRLGPQPYERLAPVYDRLIGRPFLPGLCAAFERIVRRYGIRFSTAADLGCGTGLFARHLARRWGARVYGVDRSAAMLEVAHAAGGGVRYLRQDIRRLRLPEPVDLITMNFDTINHLLAPDDVPRTLGAIAAGLRAGGHLVFDFVTPGLCALAQRALVRPVAGGGRVEQVVESCRTDGIVTIRLVHQGPGRPPFTVRNVERVHAPDVIAAWLAAAGLQPLGFHDAAPGQARSPARILAIARKLTAPCAWTGDRRWYIHVFADRS